jgi:hypothetical protein
MDYPELGYKPGTQRFRVYELLKTGEKNGRDFLQEFLPEYRSRINQIDQDLRKYELFIKHFWVPGDKMIHFEIREYDRLKVPICVDSEITSKTSGMTRN